LLLSGLSFTSALFRGEIVLYLVAFMLAIPLFWSFCAGTVLAFVHRRRGRALRACIVPEKTIAGGSAVLSSVKQQHPPLELPAILVRYRLNLITRDGRRLERIFDRNFWTEGAAEFSVPLRGAYYGAADELLIRDIFGFFTFSYKVNCGSGARLCAAPALSGEKPLATQVSGGNEHRSERGITRTDDFIEQRPYLPGDDPRRINWKLYGHAGDLFVREEDREPPPHGRLTLLLCTEADGELFGKDRAAAVDFLCEAALALATHYAKAGIEICIGACGVELCTGDGKAAVEALALPYAVTAGAAALPSVRDEKEVTILTLPRYYTGEKREITALDMFVRDKEHAQKLHILVVYRDERHFESAEATALLYNGHGGIYAHAVQW
jgi:uncharacterized protein (DUF58 family)